MRATLEMFFETSLKGVALICKRFYLKAQSWSRDCARVFFSVVTILCARHKSELRKTQEILLSTVSSNVARPPAHATCQFCYVCNG